MTPRRTGIAIIAPMPVLTPTSAMSSARMRLQIRDPFLGAASLYLDLEEKPLEWFSSHCGWSSPTACTDGKRVYWYGTFLAEIEQKHGKIGVDFVLAHEVLHCIGLDFARREGRNPILWNLAGDYRIHNLMKESGWDLLPLALYDPRFHDLSVEQIYSILKHEQEQFDSSGGGQGQDHLRGRGRSMEIGVVIEPSDAQGRPLGSEALQSEGQQWQVRVAECAETARSCGSLHGCWSRITGEVLEPKIPWEEILRRFVRDARNRRGDDFTWTPSNRRAIHRGLVFPSIEKIGMGVLDIHVDLSGSIGQAEMDRFVAEINGIREDAKPELTRILYFDTEVVKVDLLEADQKLEIGGVEAGGGTDIRVGFAWAENSGVDPACCVVLTDLCGPVPERAVGYPVIWCTTVVGSKGPWGETVEVEV